MDLSIFKVAGYDLDSFHQEYRDYLEKLKWDDNYKLLKVGDTFKKGDEFLHTRDPFPWMLENGPGLYKVSPTTQILRSLRDGLEKVKVREE